MIFSFSSSISPISELAQYNRAAHTEQGSAPQADLVTILCSHAIIWRARSRVCEARSAEGMVQTEELWALAQETNLKMLHFSAIIVLISYSHTFTTRFCDTGSSASSTTYENKPQTHRFFPITTSYNFILEELKKP